MSVRAVEYAKERGLIVEFGAEDSSRADLNFVKELLPELFGPVNTVKGSNSKVVSFAKIRKFSVPMLFR
jgi:hypothetical protein